MGCTERPNKKENEMATKIEIENEKTFIAKNRPKKPYVVICDPWIRLRYIESEHASFAAAERAADKYRKAFRERNPGGYGYAWHVGRVV